MAKPPPGAPPKKPSPPVQDVGETTRLPPLPESNESADETVEVTNPMARVQLPPEAQGAANDTRVERPLSAHEEPQPILSTDPSVDMTIPLPRILDPEPAPVRAPALPTKVEGLPGRASSREVARQDEPRPAEPKADPPQDELQQSKPVDIARRATVLKINPETIQSWLTEGPSGEHKAPAAGGVRPLIEDLRDELEAESRQPAAAEGKAESPAAQGRPGSPRASSDKNARSANIESVSTAPKIVLRPQSNFRDRAKKLSSTLSMLLKQESARRRRGFLFGLLSVLFLAGLGYFVYVYLGPLLLPLLKR